ncbi:MAG: hypothetical protein M3Q87_08495 [Actinomycetota bacterium]|nr:hypothetical protein [Actinomycetota bacterium]
MEALTDAIAELLAMDEPRQHFVGLISGLDVVTPDGPLRVFGLLHQVKPVLLDLGGPGSIDITPWKDRVQHIGPSTRGRGTFPSLEPSPVPQPC